MLLTSLIWSHHELSHAPLLFNHSHSFLDHPSERISMTRFTDCGRLDSGRVQIIRSDFVPLPGSRAPSSNRRGTNSARKPENSAYIWLAPVHPSWSRPGCGHDLITTLPFTLCSEKAGSGPGLQGLHCCHTCSIRAGSCLYLLVSHLL